MGSNMKDSGERQNFETGAVRDTAAGKPRPDLISPHAAMREGIWMGLGAEKYQPRNWEKGIPISRCIASLERHLVAYKLGLRDEDHMAAVRTNAGFILHFEEEIKAGALPASLSDMPHYGKAGYPAESVYGAAVPPWRRPAPHQDEDFIQEPATDRGTGSDPTCRGERRQKPFTVYLCGPITGDPIDHAWRDQARVTLAEAGIRTLDPLRGKQTADISNQGMSYKGELASPEMADRDKMDVEEADVILAHFPYAPPRQSIGSLMEMGGAAIGMKKPIVLCTHLKEFTEHLFTRRFCIIEPVLHSALEYIADMAKTKKYLMKGTK